MAPLIRIRLEIKARFGSGLKQIRIHNTACFYVSSFLGVNIRPELVIESIPGLYFSGGKAKSSPRNIVVDYVAAPAEDSDRETDAEGFSVTDSTTSRFEAAERRIDAESLEQTIKAKLKQKVLDILVAKYNLKIQSTEEKKQPASSSPPQSQNFSDQVSTLIKNVEELKEDIEEVSVPFAAEQIQEKKVHVDILATDRGDEGAVAHASAAGNLEGDKDQVEKSSDIDREEEKLTEKANKSQLSTEDSVPSYSGSFEEESSDSSPSGTEQEIKRGIEAVKGENNVREKEEKEEQVEEENDTSEEGTEEQGRLLSTIEEVSSVESSQEESISTLRQDPGAIEAKSSTDDLMDKEVGSGPEESVHGTGKFDIPVPVERQENTREFSIENVQSAEELPFKTAGLGDSQSKDDCEVAVPVDVLSNKEVKVRESSQLEIVITQIAVQETLNLEPGNTTGNDSLEAFVVGSRENTLGGSGDSLHKSGTYVILQHGAQNSMEEMTVDLNISRGDLTPEVLNISRGYLTPEVSIQIDEEDDGGVEDEEDLATNAPSILFDTEEPLNVNGRPAAIDACLSDAMPEASHPPLSDAVSELDTSPQALSIGEVLLDQGAKSEGEVSALSVSSSEGAPAVAAGGGGGFADASGGSSAEESSVEVRKNKRKSETNLLRSYQLLGRSATPPSLSEGEWRASPRQMQRLYTMAAAFGLVNEKL